MTSISEATLAIISKCLDSSPEHIVTSPVFIFFEYNFPLFHGGAKPKGSQPRTNMCSWLSICLIAMVLGVNPNSSYSITSTHVPSGFKEIILGDSPPFFSTGSKAS